jgi:hypothetical protein
MQITIDLGRATVEAELPEGPSTFPDAPVRRLYGYLQNFYPENLLKKDYLYGAQACRDRCDFSALCRVSRPGIAKARRGRSS